MKALLKVGYQCNNNCCFCHSADLRNRRNCTTQQLMRKIDLCADSGHDMVVLSGGEPTVRHDLLHLGTYAVRRGLDLGLVTNGRMLAYPRLLDRLLGCGLRYVHISLHGDRQVHDKMVRATAHAESLQGIYASAAHGLRPTINCVVTRHNVLRLRSLIDLLATAKDSTIKFSMVEAKGSALADFEQVVPPVSQAAAAIADAIDYAQANGQCVRHDGMPFCLFPDHIGLFDDLQTSGFSSMSEADEEQLFPVDNRNKVKPEETCGGCAEQVRCPGLYQSYCARRGSSELRRLYHPWALQGGQGESV